MNEYDSGKIGDVLNESHQLTLSDTPDDADVLILNTCSIREKAQEKVFSDEESDEEEGVEETTPI